MITPSFSLTATERVLPRLALDFTTASLDPRVTFTRTGNTATVVNSSGHIAGINADLPRFDFDPVTLASKGLLIEEARTNRQTYSNAFDDASWLLTNMAATAPASETSPDGTNNAYKITEDTTASTNHRIASFGIGTLTATTTYTASIYAKQGTRQYLAFGFTTGGTNYINAGFDLQTGVVTATYQSNYTNVSSSIQNAGNGWYRCIITATTDASTTGLVLIGPSPTATWVPGSRGSPIYNGASGDLLIYGCQFEQGAFATSYIPTTTAALTRNADVATMTGTNFSDWYNATEGSFECQFQDYAPGALFSNYLLISDGTTANRQILFRSGNATSVRYQIDRLSVNQMQQTATITSTANDNKGALAYKVNNCAFSMNAGTVLSDASVTLPTVNQLGIGVGLNGYMKEINYWPQRLTNAELQSFSK
jgi:hypothetical protein